MNKLTQEKIEEDVLALVNSDYVADSKLQHLAYIFIGYRDFVNNRATKSDSPYSPGSARDFSWQNGRNMAESELQ